ncbi:hypothetical protein GPECTOR_21g748 [Gonium pectorale]|uniref:SRCR domain-containing protein n=1 Tax=Gonium pectorale TaxID=33097 RepID=A0A150GI70_GONPE|nr:hypothetical protein GPECTOR_21g748 [Gonium pectorale]|eukprot:KXZ49522.1 hypothetical protein GPECTOR_21g748 [Gonium pectorale]
MPKTPPSSPPHPSAPEPPPKLPIRLIGPRAAEGRGIVQLQDPQTGEWGAFCIPAPGTPVGMAPASYDAMAYQACSQLGLPYRTAAMYDARSFPEVPGTDSMRAVAFVRWEDYACYYSELDDALSECNGVWYDNASNCTAYGMEPYRPAGVVCSASKPQPSPPPAPPRPRPPSLGLSSPLVTRITHPWTRKTNNSDGSPVTRGRLEYACRQAGLPYKGADTVSFYSMESRTLRPLPKEVPYWLTIASGCELGEDGGLSCRFLGGPEMTPGLLSYQNAKDALEDYDMMETIIHGGSCNRSLSNSPEYELFVNCTDDVSPPMSPSPPPPRPKPPTPPAPPPSPPARVRNSVKLRAKELLPGSFLYGMLEFGVLDPKTDKHVWGTLYWYQDYGDVPSDDPWAAAAMCSTLTRGSRTTGQFIPLEEYGTTRTFPNLPPASVREAVPVALHDLDCYPHFPLTQPLPLEYCDVVPAAPLPTYQDTARMSSSLANMVLSCTKAAPRSEVSYWSSDVLQLRLAGGLRSSFGRLEALTSRTSALGWGTVCSDGFTEAHAQAACRDMGLPWSRARLLPASALNTTAPANQPVVLEALDCWGFSPNGSLIEGWSYGATELSLIGGCHNGIRTLSRCGHDEDVVIECRGEDQPRGWLRLMTG